MGRLVIPRSRGSRRASADEFARLFGYAGEWPHEDICIRAAFDARMMRIYCHTKCEDARRSRAVRLIRLMLLIARMRKRKLPCRVKVITPAVDDITKIAFRGADAIAHRGARRRRDGPVMTADIVQRPVMIGRALDNASPPPAPLTRGAREAAASKPTTLPVRRFFPYRNTTAGTAFSPASLDRASGEGRRAGLAISKMRKHARAALLKHTTRTPRAHLRAVCRCRQRRAQEDWFFSFCSPRYFRIARPADALTFFHRQPQKPAAFSRRHSRLWSPALAEGFIPPAAGWRDTEDRLSLAKKCPPGSNATRDAFFLL